MEVAPASGGCWQGGTRRCYRNSLREFTISMPSSTTSDSLAAESHGREAAAPSWLAAIACPRDLINLWAIMPRLRPRCSYPVDSHCSAPSGVIPGDAAIGRAWMRVKIGEDGAGRRPGPDCFFSFRSKVFSANFKDPVVIFLSVLVPSVI